MSAAVMRTLGEWWLLDNDDLHFADSVIGDDNHEYVALQRIWCELSEAVEIAGARQPILASLSDMLSPLVNGDPDQTAVRCCILDWSDMEHRGGKLTDDEVDDIHEWLRREIGWDCERYDLAVGGNNSDARDYAVRNWDWIRFREHEVDVFHIFGGSLGRIVTAYYEICSERHIDPDRLRLNIYELSSGVFYCDLPLVLLESLVHKDQRQIKAAIVERKIFR